MKIQATTRPLLVQYQLEGKHYGVEHNREREASGKVYPFEETRLAVGEEIALGEGDKLVAVRYLSE